MAGRGSQEPGARIPGADSEAAGMDVIDLRSDTVTRPSPAMFAAAASADLGDDILDGDPTTGRLEARAAELAGHEAALFVPSGSMGNLIAALTHTRPADELLIDRQAHFLNSEFNALTAIAGLNPVAVDTPRGHLNAPEFRAAVAGLVPMGPQPTLLWLENTNNLAGGTVQTAAQTAEVCDLAHQRGLKVHLDGARVHNAAVAQGLDAARLTSLADSVMYCLSKGLGCPVGSVLCGSGEFIARARIHRKRLGGSLRQSGVLAAMGLVALEQNVDRLAEDHANARWLAEQLAELPGVRVDLDRVETNIIWFGCDDRDWPARCAAAGVRFVHLGDGRCRAVCHLDVSREQIAEALERMSAAARS